LALFGIRDILDTSIIINWTLGSKKFSIENEISSAGKSQLVLAETHADKLDRYINGNMHAFNQHFTEMVRSNFGEIALDIQSHGDLNEYCVVDSKTGKTLQTYQLGKSGITRNSSSKFMDAETLSKLNETSQTDKAVISSLIKKPDGKNVFLISRKVKDKLVIAELSTDFFTKLAGSIRVGNTGHAAIFDAQGDLIAHPNKTWQAMGRNIAKLAPVNLATQGNNGVMEFFSPATQTQMLAGFASIPSTQWGLMIPRNKEEIIGESRLVTKTASIIFTLILAAILLGCIMVSNVISGPLERLNKIVKKVGKEGNIEDLKLATNHFAPTENQQLEQSFVDMAKRLRSTHNKMKMLAYTDSVTSLPNREAFTQIMENSLAEMAKRDLSGVMLFIDICNFKEINDGHGHNVGDQVLRTIGSRISSILELLTGHSPARVVEGHLDSDGIPKACIARFRGNEFVIFIPENNGLGKLSQINAQILEAVRSPISGLHTNIKLFGHIGMASFPEHGLTYDQLIKKTDIAVFHAKKSVGESIKRYGDGTGELTAGEIRRDVHLAISNDEFELFYQPKVNTISNDVDSVEALIRWFHPTRGLISPADFIPVIEGSDITNALGEWVVRRACRDMKDWQNNGRELNIAVNIASRQFCSQNFVERIHAILMEEDCDPRRLEIEVTEETALSGDGGASEVISKLHKLGFKVSLDDYGRGYSNLTRLSELRVNTIKIDGPLTARITRDERTRVIFEVTINMAKGLNCKTVAEGVETAEEAAILRRLGCTELQGFYFATPMAKKNLTEWINKRENPDETDAEFKMALTA